MNTEKRNLAFCKVRNHVKVRNKDVRFDAMPPSLDRELDLRKDLHLLEKQNYQSLEQLQSNVVGERFDAHAPLLLLKPPPGDFWSLVFNSDWEDCSSLRVCQGELLSLLQERIYLLMKRGLIKTYTISKFDKCSFKTVGGILMNGITQSSEPLWEDVKISFSHIILKDNNDQDENVLPKSIADIYTSEVEFQERDLSTSMTYLDEESVETSEQTSCELLRNSPIVIDTSQRTTPNSCRKGSPFDDDTFESKESLQKTASLPNAKKQPKPISLLKTPKLKERRGSRRASMARSVTMLGANIRVSIASDTEIEIDEPPIFIQYPQLMKLAPQKSLSTSSKNKKPRQGSFGRLTNNNASKGNLLPTNSSNRIGSRLSMRSQFSRMNNKIKFKPSIENIEVEPVVFYHGENKSDGSIGRNSKSSRRQIATPDNSTQGDSRACDKDVYHPLDYAGLHNYCLTDPKEFLLSPDKVEITEYESRTAARRALHRMRKGRPVSAWECAMFARQNSRARQSLRNYIVAQGMEDPHGDHTPYQSYSVTPEPRTVHWEDGAYDHSFDSYRPHQLNAPLNTAKLNKVYSIGNLRRDRLRESIERPPPMCHARLLQRDAIIKFLEAKLGGTVPKVQPTPCEAERRNKNRTRRLSTLIPALPVISDIPKAPPLPEIPFFKENEKLPIKLKGGAQSNRRAPNATKAEGDNSAKHENSDMSQTPPSELFKHMDIDAFDEMLLCSLAEFIVRKEVVTRKSGPPVVSLTFNKHVTMKNDGTSQ